MPLITDTLRGKTLLEVEISHLLRDGNESTGEITLTFTDGSRLTIEEMGQAGYMRFEVSQPTSPQTKRQGPFIPTVQDLHTLFAEEETRLERKAKKE